MVQVVCKPFVVRSAVFFFLSTLSEIKKEYAHEYTKTKSTRNIETLQLTFIVKVKMCVSSYYNFGVSVCPGILYLATAPLIVSQFSAMAKQTTTKKTAPIHQVPICLFVISLCSSMAMNKFVRLFPSTC